VSTDNERSLRTAAIVGTVAVVGAAAWGVYIFAGIAISGYTLGRQVTTDLLAVLPPLAAGAALGYGAVVAVRAARDEDWLVRLIAVALFLVEGALGVTLFGYGAWEGSRVVYTHATRAPTRRPSTRAVIQQGPITIVTPPARADSAPTDPRTP